MICKGQRVRINSEVVGTKQCGTVLYKAVGMWSVRWDGVRQLYLYAASDLAPLSPLEQIAEAAE